MNAKAPVILIPRRICATEARRSWVSLLAKTAQEGHPVEITRRKLRSVFLVRAEDFESRLRRGHPWSGLRARLASRTFRPNGLEPGVTHRWSNASSTWIRDRFGEVLELVDEDGEPMLVTRRGKSGLMLVSQRLLESHWCPQPQEGVPVGGRQGGPA
jgi:PHD/YefM family antitoxin component YafN of YafNO toxin-antitoxin module